MTTIALVLTLLFVITVTTLYTVVLFYHTIATYMWYMHKIDILGYPVTWPKELK